MTENINWKIDEDDENHQEESSSRHLLVALEDLLKRSHNSCTTNISKIKYQSKSVDDLLIYRQTKEQQQHSVDDDDDNNNNISNTARTELDLSGIGYDHEYDLTPQRSRSAPSSPTNIYDKELANFIQCDQQQKFTADNFVYNIDLSDSDETSHQPSSRTAIFFDDDFSSEEIDYEPPVSITYSSLINTCLTITEENEQELEELRRADDDDKEQEKILLEIHDIAQTDILENDNQINEIESQIIIMNTHEDDIERLSTIYESPSPQLKIEEEEDLYDDIYDKLIVYDIANVESNKQPLITNPILEPSVSISLPCCSPIIDPTRIGSCYTDASFKPCPHFNNTLPASHLCGTTTMIPSTLNNPSHHASLLTSSNDEKSSSSPVINSHIIPSYQSFISPSLKQQLPSRSSPILRSTTPNEPLPSIVDNNKLTLPQKSSQHIKKMKVIQSSSSSLSDFITPILTSKNTTDFNNENISNCLLTDQISSRLLIKTKSSDNNKQSPLILLSHCASNPIHGHLQESSPFISNHLSINGKNDEKLSSDSSSSSELLSSTSDNKLLSRSDFILQQEQNISQQRKAFSLKSISMNSPQQASKILYPIDFEMHTIAPSWYRKQSSHSRKVPTSDSGIVIDTQLTSKSSIDEDNVNGILIDTTNNDKLKQYRNNYHKTLTDLSIIKKNIVDIESRLNEAMRELEIEQSLIEGEHELVFKQILDASDNDQQKIRHLYHNLQLLIERIMTEKKSICNEIDYTQQNLFKLDHELHEFEQQYQPSDEKILQKKEIIATTRKKYEDLEFRLMELETRCETQLEQTEEHFQREQIIVTQNAKIRQNTLRDLDHQQHIILHQVLMEKEKLEQERQKLKVLFKQKKLEAKELQQKINSKNAWLNGNGANHIIYQSTPTNLYSLSTYKDSISSPKIRKKDDPQEQLNEIKEMIALAKLEKMTILQQQQLRERYDENIKRIEFGQKLADEIQNRDYQVKLREKNRNQERPLTRYLPIRSLDFNLRGHIEAAGHLLNSPHISITSTSCRGYLYKMGGMKFKTWNRRWFVFDRQHRSLSYYQDKTETKLRGCIYFQSIVEVYVDHLQSISLRLPEPREATFIVKTIDRSYYLVAPTVESMRIWVDVIITGAEGNTFAGEN